MVTIFAFLPFIIFFFAEKEITTTTVVHILQETRETSFSGAS